MTANLKSLGDSNGNVCPELEKRMIEREERNLEPESKPLKKRILDIIVDDCVV